MEIKEICLRNFMSFNDFSLELNYPFVFLIGETISVKKRELIDAIKFIIGPEYCEPSEASTLAQHSVKGGGYVRIKFLIANGEEEPKTLTAIRTFDKIDVVFYKLNETSDFVSVEVFQKKFQTNPTTCYPFFECDFDQFGEQENLLHFWNFDISRTLESYKDNMFVLDVNNKLKEDDNKFLQIALKHQRMLVNYERIENFKIFVKFINTINQIFQKLTDGRNSVIFYIEDNETLINLTQSNLNDAKIKNIVTLIYSKDTSYLWTSREPYLRELLKIATKISFATFFNQHIIFLKENNSLQEHHAMELLKENILEKYRSNENQEVPYRVNYIQKIVETCKSLKLTVFFEYDGNVDYIKQTTNVHCPNEGKAYSFNQIHEDFVTEDLSTILEESFIPDYTGTAKMFKIFKGFVAAAHFAWISILIAFIKVWLELAGILYYIETRKNY